MTSDRLHRVRSIFLDARAIEPAERAAVLDDRCGDDAALRAEVESLLEADARPGTLVDLDVDPADARLGSLDHLDETERRIGPYTLIGILGEGGFGVVYLAEQTRPVRRRVAIKVIKAGTDSKSVLRRFDAERRVLAMMDHPNIARIIDAGATAAGLPYFAMEHVAGPPITVFCDRERLDVEARLELFAQVCDGVQHAHAKGIIHRDLKPSNVLITTDAAGAARPRVIDFGVAKALHQPVTEGTVLTVQGLLVGTPEYMSPEQIDATSAEVDTRSDVYALGVLLYELLVGARPFELEGGGLMQLQRLVGEPPPRPSTRLSALGREAESAATHRRVELADLHHRLRGELQWIPLKAMRKLPADRYQTVADLARDVRGYVAGDVVSAVPATPGYRLRKTLHRHRVGVGLLATAVLAVLAAIGGTTTGLVLQARAAREARASAAIAEEAAARADAEAAAARAAEAAAEEARSASELRAYAARIAAAHASIAAHDAGLARATLAATPAHLRDWEYDFLVARLDRSSRRIDAHAEPIHALAVSRDGARLFTSGHEGAARGWRTDDLVVDLRISEGGSYRDLALSGDGRLVAVSSDHEANPTRVWDTESGALLATRAGPAHAIAFAPHGALLAIGHVAGPVEVWDARENRVRATLPHAQSTHDLAFSPDSRHLATLGTDNVLRLFDWRQGTVRWHHPLHPGAPRFESEHGIAVAFAPDGGRVAASDHDGRVILLDAATGARQLVLRAGSRVRDLAFDPDGVLLLGATDLGPLVAWDTTSGEPRGRMIGGVGSTLCVAVTPDGRRAFSGGLDRTLREWDLDLLRGDRRLTEIATGPRLRRVHLSPAGERLVTLTHEPTVWVSEVRTGRMLARLAWSGYGATAAEFIGEDILLTASWDAMVRAWDLSSAREITRMEHPNSVLALDASRDGRWFVTGGRTGRVERWSLTDWTRTDRWSLGAGIRNIGISPDGRRIGCARRDGVLFVLDAASGERLAEVRLHAVRTCWLAWSPDGRYIATSAEDGTICLWDVPGARRGATMRQAGPVEQIAFLPGGRRLIATGGDKTFSVWDVATGELMLRSAPQRDALAGVAVTPDGRTLVTSAAGLRIWDLDVPSSETLRARVRNATAVDLVAQRRHTVTLMAALADDLAADPTLEPDLRDAAIAVTAAQPDDPEALRRAVWSVVCDPGHDARRYATVLRWARLAAAAAPDDVAVKAALAGAHFRTGGYADALAILDDLDDDTPGCLALRAMTRFALGEQEAARTDLDRLGRIVAEGDAALAPSTRALATEAIARGNVLP